MGIKWVWRSHSQAIAKLFSWCFPDRYSSGSLCVPIKLSFSEIQKAQEFYAPVILLLMCHVKEDVKATRALFLMEGNA